MSGTGLVGRGLAKAFAGGTRALDGVSFEAPPGRVLVLLGPSGCGKSTLLRIVAGLEAADAGALSLDGAPLDDVPAGRRDVGFVFQNYALYPHLTVAGNLELALEVRGMTRDARRARVAEVAAMLGLDGLLGRRPAQLSGGQQQRVALGRALVRRPRLYLLDEPLSNLDAALRETTRAELKTLFRSVRVPVVYVTHDQSEAMALADTVAVMRDGRIVQCAGPEEVHARPADRFVATFVGSPRMTVIEGPVEGGALRARGLDLPWTGAGAPPARAALGLRPEDVEVLDAPAAGAREAELVLREPQGSRTLLTLRVGGETLRALAVPGDRPGRVWVTWAPEHEHWFDAATGGRTGGEGGA